MLLSLGQLLGLLLQGGLGIRFLLLNLLQLELDPVELLSLLLEGDPMRILALLQARLDRAFRDLQLLCVEEYNQ